MGWKDFLAKKSKDKEYYKEIERQEKMQHILLERQKSANERELDRFIKEDKERQIKEALDRFREQRKQENMKSNYWKKDDIQQEQPKGSFLKSDMLKGGNWI